MNLLDEVLKQPWAVQVALASGYTAYMVSFTGVRFHHKAVDVAFGTLTLGLIASAALGLLHAVQPIVAGLIAFLVTVAFGLAWRKWLSTAFRWLMRRFNFSWSDDTPSALAALTDGTQFGITQISVLKKDGSIVSCADASLYESAPFGPCRIGPDGDIAFYVDGEKSKDGVDKNIADVIDAEWGDRVTYIPASQIAEISIRHTPIIARETAAFPYPSTAQT